MPDFSTDAFINNEGKAQIYQAGATARTLTLGASAGDSGTVIVDGVSGGALTVGSGGAITATGQTFFSSLATVRGTLAAIGGLKIYGNLSLSSNNGSAVTSCNVTPQGADEVDVSGTALLGGRLLVMLSGTFTRGPTCITRFTLLHTGVGRTGTFSGGVSIQGIPPDAPFTPQINYDGNNVYLDLVFSGCP